ncbi:MAG TPA: hypothetical protein VK307_00550 [Thermoleophilaceae bacterium]|nr:hypothetical protein [Thermoleophilaceae bacterium]
MPVLVTLAIGLIWWVTAWSFGIKAFDAFLLTVGMVVVAAAAMMLKPFMDQVLGKDVPGTEERGAAL